MDWNYGRRHLEFPVWLLQPEGSVFECVNGTFFYHCLVLWFGHISVLGQGKQRLTHAWVCFISTCACWADRLTNFEAIALLFQDCRWIVSLDGSSHFILSYVFACNLFFKWQRGKKGHKVKMTNGFVDYYYFLRWQNIIAHWEDWIFIQRFVANRKK